MDGRRRCDERQHDNQPDKRHKRGTMRGQALAKDTTQHMYCSICKYDVVCLCVFRNAPIRKLVKLFFYYHELRGKLPNRH